MGAGLCAWWIQPKKQDVVKTDGSVAFGVFSRVFQAYWKYRVIGNYSFDSAWWKMFSHAGCGNRGGGPSVLSTSCWIQPWLNSRQMSKSLSPFCACPWHQEFCGRVKTCMNLVVLTRSGAKVWAGSIPPSYAAFLPQNSCICCLQSEVMRRVSSILQSSMVCSPFPNLCGCCSTYGWITEIIT